MYQHVRFQHRPCATGRARLGTLETAHGSLQTPAFIFCGTKAAIKGLTPRMMREAGTQIMLSNTYHLMLQPGADVVAAHGGLHTFMGWQGPMLTDSGGFQIFSLGHGSVSSEIKGQRMMHRDTTLLEITEEGATFRAYTDGRIHLLTPERSMDIQRKLGADLIVAFDECTPYHVDKAHTQAAMLRTHRWAQRSLQAFQAQDNGRQGLYGVIQGGVYPDLRAMSCDFVNQQDFFGHAVGGSLGAHKQQMYDVIATTLPLLHPERPVHLLGIGGIEDIFVGVRHGVDTFDCVHPTRLARHGGALVRPLHQPPDVAHARREHINLRNQRYRTDDQPIEPDCPCATCQHHPRGYLHHLLKAKELLACTLITTHNVQFMNRLMAAIREAMAQDTLDTTQAAWTHAA